MYGFSQSYGLYKTLRKCYQRENILGSSNQRIQKIYTLYASLCSSHAENWEKSRQFSFHQFAKNRVFLLSFLRPLSQASLQFS